jgi:hypothetical protein
MAIASRWAVRCRKSRAAEASHRETREASRKRRLLLAVMAFALPPHPPASGAPPACGSGSELALPPAASRSGVGCSCPRPRAIQIAKEKGARPQGHAPLSVSCPCGRGLHLRGFARFSRGVSSRSAGFSRGVSSDVRRFNSGFGGGFGSFRSLSPQPARVKAVPATAARMSLRMRYNPWIEVNRAGQAARRKAYSWGRLRDLN